MNITHSMEPSNVLINGVHGKPQKTVGRVALKCSYKNRVHDVDFQVLDDVKRVDILGRADCVKFGLIVRVHGATCESGSESGRILAEYQDLFDG